MVTSAAEMEAPLGRRGAKLAEMVARDIVHDIATRRLAPGTVLPSEVAMAAHYKVGRATLREALRVLEIQGLVQIKAGPAGGPVVSMLSSRDFGRMATLHFFMGGATYRELIEARLVMEPVMARQAAERQDPEGMRLLEASLEAMERSKGAADDASYMQMGTDFHGVVAGISGNRILDLIGRGIKEIHTERLTGMVYPKSARERVLADHKDVARAILNGQAARAERLMRAHMEEFMRYTTKRFPGMLDEVVDWR
jgi:GntR family transcriptional regulator, transcriptional repressor for pyruvate dehydrogenase complex